MFVDYKDLDEEESVNGVGVVGGKCMGKMDV